MDGPADEIRIEPDPERLALYGVTLQQRVTKIWDANRSFDLGTVRLGVAYRLIAAPIFKSRDRALGFLILIGLATLFSLALFWLQAVTVKLLPFDNKPEFQIVVDRARGV